MFGLLDDEDEDDENNGDLNSAFAYDELSESLLCYYLSTASDGDGHLLGLEFEFESAYISADDEDDSSFADTNKIKYSRLSSNELGVEEIQRLAVCMSALGKTSGKPMVHRGEGQ